MTIATAYYLVRALLSAENRAKPIRLARNDGFNAPTLRRTAAIVQSHQVTFRRAWDEYFWVELQDGRTLGVPLVWFPRLLNATAEKRLAFELNPQGIHWDELDEDISMDGLLAGFGDLSQSRRKAA